MEDRYTFGDTPAAEDRLDLLAAVFDRPSRAFLTRTVTGSPRLALDLGCGPGNTTWLIREATGAHQVIGLDRSAAFVQSALDQSALDRAAGGVEFRVWDAEDPLPAADPDLVYARMLLAHLPEPARFAASWAAQLGPGGQLLLDEVDHIETSDAVFREYLDMVVARVRLNKAQMYAGPLFDGIMLPPGCRVEHDEVVAHPVPAADAARMFRLNLSVWRDWAAQTYGSVAVRRLEEELSRITAGESTAGESTSVEITWRLRQLVIRRDR
jgi:trans-aconitate 2-methyltransferase